MSKRNIKKNKLAHRQAELQRKYYNSKVSRAELQQILQQMDNKIVFLSGFIESKFPGEMEIYLKEIEEKQKADTEETVSDQQQE